MLRRGSYATSNNISNVNISGNGINRVLHDVGGGMTAFQYTSCVVCVANACHLGRSKQDPLKAQLRSGNSVYTSLVTPNNSLLYQLYEANQLQTGGESNIRSGTRTRMKQSPAPVDVR